MNELEISYGIWFNAQAQVQRFRGITVLEWICHLRLSHPPWVHPEEAIFATTMRNKFMWGAPAS